MRTRRSALLAIALAASFATALAAQPLPSSVVAYTGQTAPGTGGATYFLLYQPTITAAGDIAFRAELTGAGVNGTNQKGLWRTSGGGPVGLFLRAGNPTPLPGTTWSTDVGSPTAQLVDGTARAGFYWGILDGGPLLGALWSEQPGGLRAVALQGAPAPGIPGATFQPGLPLFDVNFDEAGELAFRAAVSGGGVTSANDEGLWYDDGTTTTLVAREGDAAPGFPAGTFFPGIQSPNVRVAPGSRVTFWSNPFVPAVGMNQNGIWSTRSGTLSPVVLQGGAAPGLGPGETIGPGVPYANRNGQIAFLGTIYASGGGIGGYGLWISDPGGSPALVYRAPLVDPPFQLLGSQFFFADDGIFYLIGNVFSSGPPHQSILAIGPSGWREIVRVGDRVAGLNAGIVYSLFDQYLVNGYDQVAFRATISGPGVTGGNNKVLVSQGADLEFHLVARTGDALEVSPGLFRTISGLNLTQITGGGPGVLRGFADNGALTWYAGTGGTSSAILVTELTIPPNILLKGLEVIQVVQDWNDSVPLVAGKRTFVRAHFESEFSAHVVPLLRARPAGGGPDLPFSPLRPSNPGGRVEVPLDAAAERADLARAAIWELPSDWTAAGEVELEVELFGRPLDCLESAGPTPNDCQVVASFVGVPRPEIRLVSFDYDNGVETQRVSLDQRIDLAARLVSAYPVDGLAWSTSSTRWPIAEPDPDTCLLSMWLYRRKLLDRCFEWLGCRTIYYGALLHPGEVGCSPVGGTAGVGYMPADPSAKGRHSHTHEIGHLLGLYHPVDPILPPLPNGRLIGFCSEDSPIEASPFPYIHEIDGLRRPTLGPLASGENAKVFGLDALQRLAVPPDRYFELMSYCSKPVIDVWPSKESYEVLKGMIETRFAPPLAAAATSEGASDALLVSGAIDLELGAAAFEPAIVATVDSLPPAPSPGTYTLRVHRVGGGVEDTSFQPEQLEAHNATPTVLPFVHLVDSPATVAAIELLDGGGVIASAGASANAPTVQLLAPNGGELLDQPTVDVSWAASDVDGDPLLFVVQFSADGGTSWTTLETNALATSATIQRSALAGTIDGRFRVQVSDGLRTSSDDSDASFAVADNAPLVAITRPANGELFYDGQALMFEAIALDPEDGMLSGAALSWSSSLDGLLGTGSPLALAADQLTEGLHVLTLTATDLASNTVQVSLQFRIDQPALLFEDDFESGGLSLWSVAP
ncbi:MAG: choice-of-anchor tandem repeat NxxGxxAF-containing protein [Thermoanaerobaculia bacterium]